MTRVWLRRTLTSILGLVFAASMSLSAVQATKMAATMVMTPGMAGDHGNGNCADCDHGKGGMTAMDCGLLVCGTSGVATLTPLFGAIVRTSVIAVALVPQPSLVGWAHPPDPYPPRSRILG